MLACLLSARLILMKMNFLHEFTENCFAVFDHWSCTILLLCLCLLHFFPGISCGYLLKIFDKTIEGEHNSVSLHFYKFRQKFFFFLQSLEVRVSEIFLIVRFFNRISSDKCLNAKKFYFFLSFFCLTPLRLEYSRIRKTTLFLASHRLKKYETCIYGVLQMEQKHGKCWKSQLFEGNFFTTAMWLSHGQLCAILKGTASLNQC